MIRLSERMKAVAKLVPQSESLADIGCDHGYLPIYLVKEGQVERAVAMDIKKGPLEAAKNNIAKEGLTDRITTRLSDGLDKLNAGEGECVIIAGMGGRLVIRILEDALSFIKEEGQVRYLVLQPQSELSYVRKSLRRMGFVCEKEDMVFEDGKFYPMGRYIVGKAKECDRQELYDLYGELLLKEKHPVLYEYLLKEERTYLEVRDSLRQMREGEERQRREQEIAEKLQYNQMAKNLF